MKGKIFYLFIFFKIICCSCLFAQEQHDTLYIESVDFNIRTFSSVSCTSFATSFRERISFRTIVEKDTIAKLDSFINKVKYPRSDRDIDVRAKFIFEKRGKNQVIICTNGYDIMIDNRLIKRNERFADFLKKLTLQK